MSDSDHGYPNDESRHIHEQLALEEAEGVSVWHYPSLRELLDAYHDFRHPIPDPVISWMRQRYDDFGGKYGTPENHTDGRTINACMTADSWQDANEELVDAVFNLLVANFKNREGDFEAWVPEAALGHVLEAMKILDRDSARSHPAATD